MQNDLSATFWSRVRGGDDETQAFIGQIIQALRDFSGIVFALALALCCGDPSKIPDLLRDQYSSGNVFLFWADLFLRLSFVWFAWLQYVRTLLIARSTSSVFLALMSAALLLVILAEFAFFPVPVVLDADPDHRKMLGTAMLFLAGYYALLAVASTVGTPNERNRTAREVSPFSRRQYASNLAFMLPVAAALTLYGVQLSRDRPLPIVWLAAILMLAALLPAAVRGLWADAATSAGDNHGEPNEVTGSEVDITISVTAETSHGDAQEQ